MATFLFLVIVSVTTLLLVAIAAEEITAVTRGIFTRRHGGRNAASSVRTVAAPQLGIVPGRALAQSRPVQAASKDWMPDQAA